MNELDLQVTDETAAHDRPERWDDAIVAGYLYDLERSSDDRD
jgi:hypothetical protein